MCYIFEKNGPIAKKWETDIWIEHWASNVAIINFAMTL